MIALPVLTPCESAGCRRWSHMRYCPDHADAEQRCTQELLDEALIELDLSRTRFADARERVQVLTSRLGIRRPNDEEEMPLDQ